MQIFNYLFPMFRFYTPWKQQKTFRERFEITYQLDAFNNDFQEFTIRDVFWRYLAQLRIQRQVLHPSLKKTLVEEST